MLLVLNRNSFRVLFDKIVSVEKIHILAFEMASPSLCQLYRHTFVPYERFFSGDRQALSEFTSRLPVTKNVQNVGVKLPSLKLKF